MAATQLAVKHTYSIGGVNMNESRTVAGNIAVAVNENVPRAKSGTLSVRTDNTTGTMVLETGHGITTGAKVDIYFTGGCRRNVTVGTVSGTSVPISGGSGNNLPIATSAVQAMVPVAVAVGVALAQIQALVGYASRVGQMTFYKTTTEVGYWNFTLAGTKEWDINSGDTVPLSDDITSVKLSHNDTANTRTMQVGVLAD
jgi:hypothetical protein